MRFGRHLGFVTALFTLGLAASPASAAVVNVSSAQALKDALLAATPGTVIEVAPGNYAFTSAIWTGKDGAQGNPITVRASKTGDVRLDFSNTEEGLVVAHADWVVEHLWVNGTCTGGGCGGGAAGIHVKASANRVVIRQSRITNWGENIKSDRSDAAEPTDGQIIGNEISNDAAAFTGGGTGIDLVGGLRWKIVGNYVHDFARDVTHYGIFVKGGAKDAVIEKNLVIGAKTLPAGSGAAVGISFGGGGTGSQYCAANNRGGGGCACETFDGIARNNIVLKTTDAGLHTKRACGSVFAHNTVYDTGLGLQVQQVGASAAVELRNSVLSKGITGTATSNGNLLNVSAADFKKLYADPDAVSFAQGTDPSAIEGKGTLLPNVTEDYFGKPRAGAVDLGAIELPTTGTVWPWSESASSSSSSSGGASSSSGGATDGGTGGSSSGGGASSSSSSSGGASSSSGGSSNGAAPGTDGDDGCSIGRRAGGSAAVGALFAILAVTVAARRGRRARP